MTDTTIHIGSFSFGGGVMQKRRKKKMLLFAVLLLAAAVLLTTVCTAVGIVQYGKRDEKRRSDAIIVLGAAVDESEPSPVFRERIEHGIRLYEEGYADKLIFTGGLAEGDRLSESAAAEEYALAHGVEKDDILIEEKSRITEENMLFAEEIMRAYGLDTAIIVSDPLHMKRAMRMASDYGIDAVSSPTPTTMYKSARTQLPFLLRETVMYIGYLLAGVFRQQ